MPDSTRIMHMLMLTLQGYGLCIYMCTCMLANLPFFAPVGGVDIDVVDIEAVDGDEHSSYIGVTITVFASG